MLTYIHIFRNGNMVQTNKHPSKEDLESIANGRLEILVVNGTVHSDGKTYEIEIHG